MFKDKLPSLIFLLCAAALPCSANPSISQIDKIEQAYRAYSMEKLFPSNFQIKLKPELEKLKEEIFDDIEKQAITIVEQDLKQSWKKYLEANFRSPEQLNNYLEVNNIELKTLQARFYEKFMFNEYYENKISKRIRVDYQSRLQAIQMINKSKQKIDNNKVLENIYELETNIGGKVVLKNKLSDYKLNMKDLVFYTKSELAKQILAEEAFMDKIKQDPNFKKKVKQSIEDAYFNAKNNSKHNDNYYFRQFYISKKADSAVEQISYLKNILLKNPNYKINKDFFNDLTLFDMVVPANDRYNFYSQQISESVKSLEEPGEVSKIIESEHGYHIVQLKKIEREVHETLDEAYPFIFKELKNKYVSEMESRI